MRKNNTKRACGIDELYCHISIDSASSFYVYFSQYNTTTNQLN